MKKLALVLTSSAALMVTLSACGDDSGAQTDEWAKNVCDEVQPQVSQIQAANAAITDASAGDRAPADVQAADSAAFQDISAAYASLADAVDAAGDPPVDEGAQLRQDAVSELRAISESYAALQETVDGLDTSDQAAFADGLQGVAGQLQELGQSGDEALNELQSGELGQAMARQEGCQRPAEVPSGGSDESTDAEGGEGGEDGDGGEAQDENADSAEDAENQNTEDGSGDQPGTELDGADG
ncbi:small secreted protein [Streptomyces hainanensis]|uniref:Small secreted protein n=1 Tax=Streptomyces hainanensis TaxID=402648 RepID=A0A4R4TYW8_9ACTN|nr:small secreted protein [Streptomyces hainanensis]TDC79399.1 small secreted protein [Streptomyces hainanensis]